MVAGKQWGVGKNKKRVGGKKRKKKGERWIKGVGASYTRHGRENIMKR